MTRDETVAAIVAVLDDINADTFADALTKLGSDLAPIASVNQDQQERVYGLLAEWPLDEQKAMMTEARRIALEHLERRFGTYAAYRDSGQSSPS